MKVRGFRYNIKPRLTHTNVCKVANAIHRMFPDSDTKYSSIRSAFKQLPFQPDKTLHDHACKKIRKQLQNTRERLQKGEELCVIVSVSRSKEVFGSYPGAPLGKRDSELIRNALEALYPHLDSLSSEKRETAIAITRDPMIYWEFDVRKLSLQGERIVIETQAFAAN